MKNLFKKMSSIMLVLMMAFSISATSFAESPSTKKVNTKKATYEVTIGDKTITLEEGQKAQIPLIPIDNDKDKGKGKSGDVNADYTFVGDCGTLDLWASGGRVYYVIDMIWPATSFSGLMSVTDLTTGLSGGYTAVSGFSGSVATSNLSGHKYSASLSGQAFLFGVPVASVMPNYIYWTAS